MEHPERLVVVVLFDRIDLLDVTGPPEVFSLLQRELDRPAGYRVVLAAATADPVTTSARVRVLPDVTFAELAGQAVDTLVVPGAVTVGEDGGIVARCDADVVEAVRVLAGQARRVASVCVGAHLLAAAGLLEGKRATTHWSTARQLADEHPGVTVDADPIFIRDGDVWTGAGLSACLDLALALVADDFGPELASRVARQLVMFLRRPGGQSQFSVSLEPASATRRVEELRHHITEHLARPLTVADLAAHAHLTDRQLTRVFKAELGTTPAAYVEHARVEAARQRLETTDDTLSRVATTCGFGTVSTLNRSFRRTLGTTPSEYRRRFRIP
ncbi:Transcriptional regulator GlxA family, contains an amidase domain and an AraC-type DNA-binding HTH domain [Amycolatopsis pretoriensis]|uniref:Transcriptional regulator GlxA family, contains an amidase domain and an AraC-type DNA-binding HTH domain n=1 Tax=Amycolatopsis pretoriensis TaxID=218821 RepID=A0A1H5R2K9_9PSEU|nr:DJ-1/PfpI family protein [Amycolatopsis pretoriensis]SEF32636.1 Transcriptional regulator GlxA family, contains an amidase domain and an AraC-type DNA-binding HTH domain [Amycolatopsis pretoriensis]